MAALPSSLSAEQVLDRYFLEVRAKLLEIAATLDRVERSPGVDVLRGDARVAFIQQALAVLQSPGPAKAERILNLYSKQ